MDEADLVLNLSASAMDISAHPTQIAVKGSFPGRGNRSRRHPAALQLQLTAVAGPSGEPASAKEYSIVVIRVSSPQSRCRKSRQLRKDSPVAEVYGLAQRCLPSTVCTDEHGKRPGSITSSGAPARSSETFNTYSAQMHHATYTLVVSGRRHFPVSAATTPAFRVVSAYTRRGAGGAYNTSLTRGSDRHSGSARHAGYPTHNSASIGHGPWGVVTQAASRAVKEHWLVPPHLPRRPGRRR